MTQQIKPTQLTPSTNIRPNPNVGLPRDLRQAVQQPAGPDVNLSGLNLTELILQGSEQIIESAVALESVVPQTPIILAIKSQSVVIQTDGTTKIDVVLEIQDVDHAVEYEIRVAKNAGLL